VVLNELPVYGAARREDLAEVTIALSDEAAYQRAGASVGEVVLAKEPRWFVDRVEPWEPELPPEIAAELAAAGQDPDPPNPWVALFLVGVLAVIIAMGYVLG